MLGIHFDNPQNIDVSDPVSDDFYFYFRDVARKNALIFEEVHATLPSDRVRKFDDVNGYTNVPKMKDTDPIRVSIAGMRESRQHLIDPSALGTREIERNSRSGCGISTVFP